MNKISLFLLILISFSGKVFSQHTVSGIITDKTDNSKLLEGVSVFIPEFNRFDVSREGGTYILRNVGIGIVTIQFSRLGYQTVVKTISTKDSAVVLNVELIPTTMELEEISITGYSTRLPDAIPYPVTILTRSSLDKTGAMNIMTALTYQPGIDKIGMGTGINKPVIRGLSFNRILLYQYGTRIENQPWDDRHDIGINDDGVKNVEVIKGPSTLIYGADAMGGTLVFHDEKPPVAGSIKGDVNLGFHSNTVGLEGNAGIYGSTQNGIFYAARGGIKSHTSYIQGEGDEVKKNTEDKDFAANSKWNSSDTRLLGGISKKWGVSKLTYSYYHQQIGIIENEGIDSTLDPGQFTEEQRERELEAPYQDVTSQVISLENTILIRKGKILANFSYQDNNRKEFEKDTAGQKEEAFGLLLKTSTYDVRYSSDASAKFGWTMGSQGYFQKNENFGLEGLVPDATTNDVAGYLVFRYDLPKVNFLAGGRFDSRTLEMESYEPEEELDTMFHPEIELDKEFSLFNGSLGMAFHPTTEITLKANGSSGFTAPNYAQLGTYGRHEGTYRFEKGDTSLVQEQNYEGDLGIIWESKSITLNAQGYYNQINDYIYIANTGTQDTAIIDGNVSLLDSYQYKQDDAVINGFELGLDIHPVTARWIDFNVAYAMCRGELVDGGNLPYIPADKIVGSIELSRDKLNYVYNPYARLVVSNYFDQDRHAEFESPSDGYTLLDLNLGGKFKWGKQLFEITLSLTNILNEGYYNHLSLVRTIGIREAGRDVAFNIRIPLGIKNTK